MASKGLVSSESLIAIDGSFLDVKAELQDPKYALRPLGRGVLVGLARDCAPVGHLYDARRDAEIGIRGRNPKRSKSHFGADQLYTA